MLNLARAALLPNIRILVCDEPTSNVDMATDRRLQQVGLYVCVCCGGADGTAGKCLHVDVYVVGLDGTVGKCAVCRP